MITGRLPFPDAKGPAGLITAQLKQTPVAPSQANPNVSVPLGAERVILKALEKDKNNRYVDVTAMANALQEVLDSVREQTSPHAPALGPQAPQGRAQKSPEMLDTRRGDGPIGAPPAMPANAQAMRQSAPPGVMQPMPPAMQTPLPQPPQQPYTPTPSPMMMPPPVQTPYPPNTYGAPMHVHPGPAQAQAMPQQASMPRAPQRSPMRWIWWVVGLLALGAAAGAVLALAMHR